jgi:CRP-like cAMP-binding protein
VRSERLEEASASSGGVVTLLAPRRLARNSNPDFTPNAISIAGRLQSLSPRPVSFAAGSSVFHVDDPVRHIYVVQTGSVHLLRRQPNGATLILQRAEAGSILAEASLFSACYHCDAVAVTQTGVGRLPGGASAAAP